MNSILKHLRTVVAVAVIALFCTPVFAEDVLVYVGTRGSATMPEGEVATQGIYAARLDQQTGHLSPIGPVAEFERAAWLLGHPSLPVLYAVGLQGNDLAGEARIRSFRIDAATGKLQAMDNVGAGGVDATHLDFDAASQTLFAANHGDGSITVFPVADEGRLGPAMATYPSSGGGPHPRQGRPEMHAVAVAPGGRFVIGADFGADKLLVFAFDPSTRNLTPAAVPVIATSPGTGPRHVVFHPNGRFAFVNTEITAELNAFRWNADDGGLELVQTVAGFPPEFEGTRSTAEIRVSSDGRFLYQSLRGENGAFVVYAIDADKGTLSEIQRVPATDTPWSFAIDPSGRWLVVANQSSATVNVLAVDPATGMIKATQESWPVPTPVAVMFYQD